MSCFVSAIADPFGEVINEFVVNNTTSDSNAKNTEYIQAIKTQNKLTDVINYINLIASTYFIYLTVCLRLAIVDGFCAGNKTPLLAICNSFIKTIKNLANYYNKVFIINDPSTQMANITDNNLINQFKCIRKQFLPVDSEEIYYYPDFIKAIDQSNQPPTPSPRPTTAPTPTTSPTPTTTPTPGETLPNKQKVNPISYIDFSENSELVIFISNILEFIMKISKNESFNYCIDVDLNGTELLPLLYKMFKYKLDTSSETIDKRCSMTLVKIELPFGQNVAGINGTPPATGGAASTTGGASSTTGTGASTTGGAASTGGAGASTTGSDATGGNLLNPYLSDDDTSGMFGGLSGSDVNSWNGMYDPSLFPNYAPRTQVSGGTNGSLFGYINPLTGLVDSLPSNNFNFSFNSQSETPNPTSQNSSQNSSQNTSNNNTPRPTNNKVSSYMEPPNISLINAKGPNNFFMPNIIIEDY